MGVDLREASPQARAIFEQVDRITSLAISRLCAEGPLEQLTPTEVAQPAVVATSLAALAVLRERIPGLEPAAVAGHSVGELAACVAAGALDEGGALELVAARALAMAAACVEVDGTMAAVIGLDEPALQTVCEEASAEDGSVELANLNAPGQLVISGERQAVARAGEGARAAGARRVLPLAVGGPFHSRYMRPAAEALRDELLVQVYSPVRWSASLGRLAALGCDRFLEVGPGTVLAGLVKRSLPEARVASFGTLADLDEARALLEASA